MEKTVEDVKKVVSVLTGEQQQLLKDTLNHGCWGDGDYEFLKESPAEGENPFETDRMMGYCTNDAKNAGHFEGRKISAMFRSIYRKLCPENRNQTGHILSHCRDWWGDGTGDMLFIRESWYRAFEEWSKE
jgi:hypothetical protein